MRQRGKALTAAMACAVFLSAMAGCSWFQTGNASLKGTLGATYENLKAKSVAPAAKASRALTVPVDSVCVFPAGNLDGSWPSADSLGAAETYPINEDGTFNAPMGSDDQNWVYLLLDTTAAQRRDQVVGYVSLDDGGNTLIQFPSGAVTADVDCGTLTQSGDEAVSSTGLADNAGSFSMDMDSLREIAKRDNILKAARNNYVNYDPATGIAYMLIPRFNWTGARSTVKNRAFVPGVDSITYEGYYPQFSSTDDAITLASLVSGATVLDLYPPVAVDVAGAVKTYGPTVPMTSAGADYTSGYGPSDGKDIKISASEFFAINFKVDTGETRADSFAFWPVESGSGLSLSLTDNYDGYWTLKKNGTAIGWFDLSVASPTDGAGHCVLYTPSVKVTTDGSGYVTKVDVQFYSYDVTNGYQLVTDVAGMNSIVGQYMLGLMSGTTEEYKYTSALDSGGMVFSFSDFSHDFPFATTGIQISYTVAGVNVNYWWGD
jgi:hypothetical protein